MEDIFYPGMPDWLAALNQLAKGQLQPIQADWNAMPGSIKAILNKPTLADVATTGAKADVGLGNVDNTSDANKPVSIAQASALTFKANTSDVNVALAAKAGIRSTGMKNRIINGDMRIAQRGVSGTIAGGYTLDRWILASTGTAPSWSQQRTSSSAMMDYAFDSLSWPGAAGNTGVIALQRIESVNCADLAGGKVSISFWVYQSTGQAQTMTPALVYSGGAADSWGSQVGIPALDPAVIVPSGVWTMVTNKFNVPTAAVTGLGVYPWGSAIPFGAGTAGYLSKVQLEPGDTVTPFDAISRGLQLFNCQRYYERIAGVGSEGYVTSQTGLAATVPFKAQKRVSPTMATGAASFVNCTFGNISEVSVDLARVRVTGAAAGNAAFTINITAEAEL